MLKERIKRWDGSGDGRGLPKAVDGHEKGGSKSVEEGGVGSRATIGENTILSLYITIGILLKYSLSCYSVNMEE